MKRLTVFIATAVLCTVSLFSQDITAILRAVETNNLELKALRADNDASAAEQSASNSLPGLSAEFSPFWQSGVEGLSSSELIVSQEFEFPTIYAERRRGNALRREADDLRYAEARRNILLQAQLKCLELAKLISEREILDRRHDYAHRVLRLISGLEEQGGATALDVNKTKMEHMAIEAAVARNEAQRLAILSELQAMNGNHPVPLDSLSVPASWRYPDLPPLAELREAVLATDPATLSARADIAVAAQDIRTASRSWLPSINAGYRRNAAPGEVQNGFVVGLSFPLWSTSATTRAARSRRQAAELRAEDARIQAETTVEAAYNELRQLKIVIDTYDANLFSSTIELLGRAVEAGRISTLDYYTEADAVYTKWQELIDARFEYSTTLATLLRHTL